MIETIDWELETINWTNPLEDPDSAPGSIGLVPNQYDKKDSHHFQIVKIVSPKKLLYAIDPFFEPDPKSYKWLKKQMIEGQPFSPVSITLQPDEFAFFPHDPWYSDRANLLREYKMAGENRYRSQEDINTIVRIHEGRNRTYLAIELGETAIPVSVWVQYNPYKWKVYD